MIPTVFPVLVSPVTLPPVILPPVILPPVWSTWEADPTDLKLAGSHPRGGSWELTRRRSAKRAVQLKRVGHPRPSPVFVPAVSLVHILRVTPPGGGLNALRPDGRGIDLAKRGDEVRKLFYAAFARGLVKDGFDPEEALQEVFKGLLARNRGTCPFDVTKSSFGHYVHIVTRCVLANFVRKEKTRTLYETPSETLRSGSSFDDGGSSTSGAWEGVSPANQEHTPRALVHLLEGVREHIPEGCDPSRLAVALDHMAQGHTKREAALQAGVDSKHLAIVLEHLRAGLPRRTAT